MQLYISTNFEEYFLDEINTWGTIQLPFSYKEIKRKYMYVNKSVTTTHDIYSWWHKECKIFRMINSKVAMMVRKLFYSLWFCTPLFYDCGIPTAFFRNELLKKSPLGWILEDMQLLYKEEDNMPKNSMFRICQMIYSVAWLRFICIPTALLDEKTLKTIAKNKRNP